MKNKILASALLAASLWASAASACHVCQGPVEPQGGVCQDWGEWLTDELGGS